jgi:hypothetical protein
MVGVYDLTVEFNNFWWFVNLYQKLTLPSTGLPEYHTFFFHSAGDGTEDLVQALVPTHT